MGTLLVYSAEEAYKKSLTNQLADEIWEYKFPGEDIDQKDREYISWKNSLPIFLQCVIEARLGNIYVVFEMKTPISNKAIDVLLLGRSAKGERRLLLVELKQWSQVSNKYVDDPNKVYIPEIKEKRKHPFRQLEIYTDNLKNHHAGIQKAIGGREHITFGMIAYLHNCSDVNCLTEESKKETMGRKKTRIKKKVIRSGQTLVAVYTEKERARGKSWYPHLKIVFLQNEMRAYLKFWRITQQSWVMRGLPG